MPKSTGFWTIGGGSILVFISLMLLAGASSDVLNKICLLQRSARFPLEFSRLHWGST